MISKEAELFEKANIVDIGLQPNEFGPRRRSRGDSDHLSTRSHIVSNPMETPPLIEGMENLHIDEVDKVDNNLVVDEAFQKSLDERANQFLLNETNNNNTNSFPSIPKPKVEYVYNETFTITEELNEWFTDLEVKKLQKYQQVYDSKFNVNFYDLSADEKRNILSQILSFEETTKNELVSAVCLVSILSYGQDFEPTEIINHIVVNATSVIQCNVIPWIIDRLNKNFEICSRESSNIEIPSQILFHCCTLLYSITLVGLESSDESLIELIQEQFDKANLLITLLQFIDHWRWNNKNSLRIRNILMLFSKVFKFQIGDLKKRDQAKLFLKKKLNIEHKDEDPNKLTASPIDFHTYRQELITRYPSFMPPPSKLPETFEDSTSLTQFISIPKNQPPRQMNSSNHQPPNIHISTPSPSPSTSPVGIDNKGKGKRLQSNFVYPLIYPTEGNFDSVVPKSIQEATDLFASRVRDKVHLIQLWDEFNIFVRQERGWVDAFTRTKETFDYKAENNLDFTKEIQSLNRVESFYGEALPYFSSLVNVILEVMRNSPSTLTKEDSPKTQEAFNMIKAKSAVLKDASYLLILMLKWFKVSHVLKYEHLSCLIYDSDYYSVLIQFLKGYDGEIFERIQNTSLRKSPVNEKIDDYFCFTLQNLLGVASKLTIQKTQRVLDLCEKDASSVLKQIFKFFNEPLWKPTLKIIKDIAPLKRKQWKSENMDLISLVYLHGETSLRDNWLSGRDLDAEINDRYGQEIALRALTQFYNIRRYGNSMEKMGYKKNKYSFFTREAEFSSNEI